MWVLIFVVFVDLILLIKAVGRRERDSWVNVENLCFEGGGGGLCLEKYIVGFKNI